MGAESQRCIGLMSPSSRLARGCKYFKYILDRLDILLIFITLEHTSICNTIGGCKYVKCTSLKWNPHLK